MKKCPKCGKMNFSNVSVCVDCGVDLERVPDLVEKQPSQYQGMHWFWAWLIMQGIALAGGLLIGNIIGSFFTSMSLSNLRAVLPTYAYIEMICRLLLTYLAIFVWIRLTFRRYFHAGPWIFFTYLWNITTPIFVLTQFNTALARINLELPTLWIVALIGILIGVIGFTLYRKKLEDQVP